MPGPWAIRGHSKSARAQGESQQLPVQQLGAGAASGRAEITFISLVAGMAGGRKGELSLLKGQGLTASALIVLSGEEPASPQASAGGFLVPSPCWLCLSGSYLPEEEAGCSLSCLVAWEKRHQARHPGEVSPSVCASIRALPVPHGEGFAQLPSPSGGQRAWSWLPPALQAPPCPPSCHLGGKISVLLLREGPSCNPIRSSFLSGSPRSCR